MSVATSIGKTGAMGGLTFNEATSLATDGQITHAVQVPPGETSILTLRTSDTVGELTIDDSGHTIDTGERLDLYWIESGVKKRRRGVVVGTVAGDVVPITGGTGDILPSSSTPITASEPVELDVAVLGTNVKAILLFTAKNGQFVFEDVGGEVFFVQLDDNKAFSYNENEIPVNPITGDTLKSIFVSHDDPAVAQEMKIGLAYDNA